MSTDASWPDDLPNDLAACQRELLHLRGVLAETAVVCEEQRGEIEKLKGELELFKRYLLGRRSERFVEGAGQGRLFDEPHDPPSDESQASSSYAAATDEKITSRRRRRGHGWSKLPEHLPREEVLVDVPELERTCGVCGEPLERIGEDRTERVDIRPARVVVKVIVRPKYACTHKHAGVKQGPTPPSPVPGGRFDFGFVAHVVTSKTADHLPLYRQQDVLARAGLELGRSTLCEIMAGAADLAMPLAEFLQQRLVAGDRMGADDTPVRLIDPAHPHGVRTARFWLFRGFETAPYNVFHFHESRSRDGPREFLKDFRGWVKVDAYGVDGGVYLGSGERMRASCCMAHARRKFDEARSSHPTLAAEALAMFQQLYDIEDRARLFSADQRRALREQEATPVLARFRAWLDDQVARALPKLKFGEAIRYLRNQWEALTNYVHDGRLPIDNNDTERDLRQLTIGRKNWLFIGSPEAGPRAAILYTVVASAVRHDLDVWAYLRDALERLAHRAAEAERLPTAAEQSETELPAATNVPADDSVLYSLLPDVWAKAHPESIRGYRGRERESRAAAKRAHRHRRRLAQARNR
jgi:transposase